MPIESMGFGEVIVNDASKKKKNDKAGSIQIAPLIGGLDLSSTAKKLYEASVSISKPIQDKIDLNVDEVIPEIKKVKELVEKLKVESERLSNYLGMDESRSNVLQTKSVANFFVRNSTMNPGSLFEITPSRKAQATVNPIAISVLQLASCDTKVSSSSIASNLTTALGLESTLKITIGDTVTDVNILPIHNLNDICSTINAAGLANGSVGKTATPINFTATTEEAPLSPIEISYTNSGSKTFTTAQMVDMIKKKYTNNNSDNFIVAPGKTTITGTGDYAGVTVTITGNGTESTAITGFGISQEEGSTVVGLKYDIVTTTTAPDPENEGQQITTTTTTTYKSSSDASLQAAALKATASIVKQSDNQYLLQIQAINCAIPMTLSDTTGGTVLAALKLSGTTVDKDTLIAKLTYNGIEGIVRENNTVTDLVEGCTLELKSADPDKTAEFAIDYDKSGAFTAIQEFVQAYNDVNDIVVKNSKFSKVDDAKGSTKIEINEDALLCGTKVIYQIKSMLSNISSGFVAGLKSDNDNYNSFNDIGISTGKHYNDKTGKLTDTSLGNGKFVIDFDKLKTAVTTKFSSVVKLFGAFASSSNPNFVVYDIGEGLSESIAGKPINITYQAVDGRIRAILTCDNHTSIIEDVKGSLIEDLSTTTTTENDPNNEGKQIPKVKKSIFAGLQIGYNGRKLVDGESVTTTIYATQGLADKFTYQLKQALELKSKPKKDEAPKDVNIFAVEIERILEENTQKQKKIEQITERAKRQSDHLASWMGQIYKSADKANAVTNIMKAYNDAMAQKGG